MKYRLQPQPLVLATFVAVVLSLGTMSDAAAQRAGTTSSRTGTKVEREKAAPKKNSPARKVEPRSGSRSAPASTRPAPDRSAPATGRSAPGRTSEGSRATARRPESPSRTSEGSRATARRPDVSSSSPSRQEARAAAGSRQAVPSRSGARGTTVTRGTVNRDHRNSADSRPSSSGGVRDSRGANSGSSASQGRGNVIVDSRNRPGSPGTRPAPRRDDSQVTGNRSTLRNRYRDGRRVVIPSRRWEYRRPVGRRYYDYTPTYIYNRWPRINVHLSWPWVVRYERRWAPRYRYRQVIHVETVVHGRRNYSNVEVETVYSHRVLEANNEFAVIGVEIERVELYDGNRFLGYVEDLPSRLRTSTATVYRDGDVIFDRDIFLVGDPYVGFEVVSTQAYDGYVLDSYHHTDGYLAGKVDLRRHRVTTVRSSRFFRPQQFDGMVPISLLPSDEGWLADYGVEAISANYDDYDWYYGGSAYRSSGALGAEPLRQEDAWNYTTQNGADISFKRESKIQRVQ